MSRSYIPGLDGIRGVAFLLVFLAHSGLDRLVPGGFGVTVFFFLSGYLITSLLRQEAAMTRDVSLRGFYVRRAFRILPPMFVTLGLAYVLGAGGLLPFRGNLLGAVSAVGYFYNYASLWHLRALLPTGCEVLWSLMVEEHFYFVFPLIYLIFIRKDVRPASQATILWSLCFGALLWRYYLVYVAHVSLTESHRWTYTASDARFDSILFGCILAIRHNAWLDDPAPMLRRFKGRLAMAGCGLLLMTLLIRQVEFRETLRYSMQGVALYLIFFFCISSSDGWPVRWLEWKPLRWLGWVSYSMYLIHFILLNIGARLAPGHAIAMPAVVFLLSLGYAWMMREYVERPSRDLRERFERGGRDVVRQSMIVAG